MIGSSVGRGGEYRNVKGTWGTSLKRNGEYRNVKAPESTRTPRWMTRLRPVSDVCRLSCEQRKNVSNVTNKRE